MPRPLPYLFAALLFGAGCNTVHTARPLGEGKHQVHLSVAGTTVARGSDPATPVPFIVGTYKYGVTDRLDVYGGWHVLETFVNQGNLWVDVGASYYILDQKGFIPGVSAALTLSPLITPSAPNPVWAMGDLNLTASWAFDPDDDHLVYTGFHNTLTPLNYGVIDVAPYTLSPYLGYQARFLDDALGLQAEVKWFRPYADNTDSVLTYLAPGSLGAMTFIVAVSGQFGGSK